MIHGAGRIEIADRIGDSRYAKPVGSQPLGCVFQLDFVATPVILPIRVYGRRTTRYILLAEGIKQITQSRGPSVLKIDVLEFADAE